ncbi:hypothetical protein BU17DRAFT_69019 [Hysterangium stoloniferum]|nr:hypothetical protein BU17DRAFT_69019 [Hysterangium stoloniferum]
MAGTPFFNANEQSEESTSPIYPPSWNGHDRDLLQYVRQDPNPYLQRTSSDNSTPDVGIVSLEQLAYPQVSPPRGPSPSSGQQRVAVVKYKCNCAGCDAALFSSKENARGHVRRTHFRQLDQKPFKCLHPECAKHPGFASLSAARRHVQDKAKARCPDCQSLHQSLHFHPKLLRCPDGVINAQSAMSMCHPWYYFPYFPTPINPTGGYRAADDVVIDAGGLVASQFTSRSGSQTY